MFFRRKPNKSGTFSVQVVEKREGKNVVIQRIGTSDNQIELRRLERRLQKAKAPFSLNQAREMTKNIYSITQVSKVVWRP